MVLKLTSFLFLFSVNIFAIVTISSPNDGFVTSTSSINLVFESTDDQGFLMIQNKIVPIRKVKQSVPVKLHFGENEISIYVLDRYRKIEFDLTSIIRIYRSVEIEDSVSFHERFLLTELMSRYNISLLNKGLARMDQPVLKKDMYAFLMFFYLDQSREPLTVQYSDMDVNDNYLSLYQHFSAILPEPVLNRFYPDSFVTVNDMIKLLLALENNYQSISDGNILSDFLDIPPQFKSIIPKNWDRQVQFSSRREVIHLFMNYFDYSLDRYEKQMTISWPRVSTEKTETYSKIQYKFENFIRFFKVPSFLRQPFQLFSSYEKTAKVNTKSKVNSKKVQDKSSYQSIEVLPGDSIPKISKRYFGTTKYWKDIIQLNNLEIKQVTINEKVVSSVSIFPGQKLYLPNN